MESALRLKDNRKRRTIHPHFLGIYFLGHLILYSTYGVVAMVIKAHAHYATVSSKSAVNE